MAVDEFSSMALYLSISLIVVNVVFTWLTLNGGLMALTVPENSIMASSTCYTYSASGSNTVGESAPQTSSEVGNDFTSSTRCTTSMLWNLAGGWAIALENIFNGGIFGDANDTSSLGGLFIGILMPLFIVIQIVGILYIFYMVAIAGKGLFNVGGI